MLGSINRGEPLALNSKTKPFNRGLLELVAKVRERCSDIFSSVLLDLAPELRRDEAWVGETVQALQRA